jgi:hypothetical protein
MYSNIAKSRAKHMIITDHGYYWVHLPNHRPWYQHHFGVNVSKNNYHELWDKWMRENIGFRVVNHLEGAMSQYFHMERV